MMAVAVILALVPRGNALAMVVALGGPWALGWHLAWQNRTLDVNKPDVCLRLFRANRNAGLIPALFIAASIFL